MRWQIDNPRRRRGFTLVEILTVIVIIGVLTGLLLAAAGPVRNMVRNYRMKSEVTQLGQALERVRNELGGGQYPPDATNQADWNLFLRRAFPRWNQNNFPAPGMPTTPAEALVFWLAGMVDTNSGSPTYNQFIGFSANPLNPFDISSTAARIGPFYDFDRTRTGPGSSGSAVSCLVYYPQNDLTPPLPSSTQQATSPQPYVYFKAVATAYAPAWQNGYNFNNAVPFVDAAAMRATGMSGTYIWVNPQSFQLLCPGLDGIYGATTDGTPPRYPDGNNYGQNTFDDITNFAKGKLESDTAQ
ncbi:MAG: type II secretion system protein [Thermoguttaceae bacterium]|jgi:prepilin-type N-terminal cleavage/methylation domain-containing protein